MDDAGDDWVQFNPMTMTYDTKDGTKVAAELFCGPESLAGYLYIAQIRAEQRAARAKKEQP